MLFLDSGTVTDAICRAARIVLDAVICSRMREVIKYSGRGCDMYGDRDELKRSLAILFGLAAFVAWFAMLLIAFGSLPDRTHPVETTLLRSAAHP